MMSVLLKKPIFNTVSNRELVIQMEARKKSEKKLPTWFASPKIYYPEKLHIEQTSSEITARYKSRIVAGTALVDLTGGFGVDSYFFSKKIAFVFHCEIDKMLSEIAAYNFGVLGAGNISTLSEDGISFLAHTTKHFDWLYLDPSRRNDVLGKVFRLADCLPNVLEHLDHFFKKADCILIKTSPLLDISQGLVDLGNVYQIHCVAVNNEVKELLWVLKKDFTGEVKIITTSILKNQEQLFNFSLSKEKQLISTFSEPRSYLFEPNAAIMKSGGFKSIGENFGLKKLHPNTHLYTSDNLVDFPGRRFKITNVSPFQSKTIKRLGAKKANVTVRNFPESVADIRKKHNIRDGGARYMFFTTCMNGEKKVILCDKISN